MRVKKILLGFAMAGVISKRDAGLWRQDARPRASRS